VCFAEVFPKKIVYYKKVLDAENLLMLMLPIFGFIYYMLLKMRFPVFAILATSLAFAQAVPDSVSNNNQELSADKAVFADINIFAQMPLGSIFILWTNFDSALEIKEQITKRNFVLEPFFMQNIDREQFEQKQALHLFEEQKKAFYKLFPDEEEED
jgi:hypothetical protein